MALVKERDVEQERLRQNLCPKCMTELKVINVHGHLQCSVCNCVIDDCCNGEVCYD